MSRFILLSFILLSATSFADVHWSSNKEDCAAQGSQTLMNSYDNYRETAINGADTGAYWLDVGDYVELSEAEGLSHKVFNFLNSDAAIEFYWGQDNLEGIEPDASQLLPGKLKTKLIVTERACVSVIMAPPPKSMFDKS